MNRPNDSFKSPHAQALSPTLELMEPDNRPKPLPACAQCSNAMWIMTSVELTCFCTLMRTIVWDHSSSPIMHCDGQQQRLVHS